MGQPSCRPRRLRLGSNAEGRSQNRGPQLEYSFMLEIAQIALKPATEVARLAPLQHAPSGLRYGSYGDTQLSSSDLEQIVHAVPRSIASALQRNAYYFVPLALAEPLPADSAAVEDLPSNSAPPSNQYTQTDPDSLLIAADFSTELGDSAICHRNAIIAGIDCVFISTRLMQDRFALAFELYINAGHHFVDIVGVPETFMNLLWSQAEAGVRGETSHDAWEHRMRALGRSELEQPSNRWAAPAARARRRPLPRDPAALNPKTVVDEKARTEYFEAAFADAIAIYLLSLTVDFDYAELREREYPLLVAPALAERLRHVAQIFPPNDGQEFSIRYRPRNN